jgi:hypothetical protein
VSTRLSAVVALVLVLAAATGCGDDAQAEGPRAEPTAVLQQYVRAVRAGDAEAVLGVLSSRVIRQFNLTEERLQRDISTLQGSLGGVGRTLVPAFEVRIGDELVVAALDDASRRRLRGARAFALPIVLEDDSWKVEPLVLRVGSGYPDDLSADPRRPFLTFVVTTRGNPQARLWIDGRELRVRKQPGSHVAFEARPKQRLAKGRHVVVAFAEVGDRVGALAWVIRV